MRTLPALSAVMLAAVLPVAGPAGAGSNIRILPDQAVLACQARAGHEIEARGGTGAAPAERFHTETMENYMFRVKGLYLARLDGAEKKVAVTCDVSSTGVEVFAMEVGPSS